MSSSIPLSPDQRAQKWGTIAKWAAFIVGGFLFAPFVMATITGMLGLLVAGAISAFTWFMLPVAHDMAVNLRLRLIKQEAARDPVSTLQAEYLRRSLLLEDRDKAIQTFDAKTRTFADKVEGFKRKYSPADCAKFQEDLDNMRLLVKRQRAQWTEAQRNLMQFSDQVQKASDMWEMAVAAAAAKAGTELDEKAFWGKLKTETAFNAVQDGMNAAFAQLDSLVAQSDANHIEVDVAPAQAALPAADSSNVIDVDVVKTATPVRRSR